MFEFCIFVNLTLNLYFFVLFLWFCIFDFEFRFFKFWLCSFEFKFLNFCDFEILYCVICVLCLCLRILLFRFSIFLVFFFFVIWSSTFSFLFVILNFNSAVLNSGLQTWILIFEFFFILNFRFWFDVLIFKLFLIWLLNMCFCFLAVISKFFFEFWFFFAI